MVRGLVSHMSVLLRTGLESGTYLTILLVFTDLSLQCGKDGGTVWKLALCDICPKTALTLVAVI